LAGLIDQDVARFQIAVNQSTQMRVMDGSQTLTINSSFCRVLS